MGQRVESGHQATVSVAATPEAAVIDTITHEVVGAVEVGEEPAGVAVNCPDDGTTDVLDSRDGTVAVLAAD